MFLTLKPSPPDLYTLSLHDALPISPKAPPISAPEVPMFTLAIPQSEPRADRKISDSAWSEVKIDDDRDRKSTRLNSSHVAISYAVFCLQKKMRVCVGMPTFYKIANY